MLKVALAMLFGDRAKYFTLVLGLSFAALLIAQQGAIFFGLLTRATGPLQNMMQADLWVTDSATHYISEFRALGEKEIQLVRSVPGVEWAQPLFTGRGLVELADGRIHYAQILGIDRSTLIGQPPEMVEGRLEDLRIPDAVIIDTNGRDKLGGLEIGDELKLNERRAVVVGFCRAWGGFDGNVLVYTSIEQAWTFVPTGRRRVSYILVKCVDPAARVEVAQAIFDKTGLAAFTREELRDRTVGWVIRETGIGINFGITVVLGLIVGLVIAATILYQFTSDNIRHFAVFKAMGATSKQLAMMVLVQAGLAGLIGYGIGIGGAGLFAMAGTRPEAQLVAFLPWQLLVAAFVMMMGCVAVGSLLSLHRVITVEPGLVFK